MKTRYSLRSILLLTAAVAAVTGYVRSTYLNRPLRERLSVDTREQFDARCAKGQCIVYIHGDWSVVCDIFIKAFMASAENTLIDGHIRPVIVDRSDNLDDPTVDAIVQHLYDNAATLGPRSMKSFGGHGVVFWMSDGNVIDSAWCDEFLVDGYDSVKEQLEDRNTVNFGNQP